MRLKVKGRKGSQKIHGRSKLKNERRLVWAWKVHFANQNVVLVLFILPLC